LFPLARYFCKRLQKMYGLGEPARYLNMLYPHFQKESCSFDVGRAVMSSRRKCDKRHISFLTSIYREGTTQKVCSLALHILRQERLHCIPRKFDMCGGCCDALLASEMGPERQNSTTRSSTVGVWQPATTSSEPTTSHSSSLHPYGCGCVLMSPRPRAVAQLSSTARVLLRPRSFVEVGDQAAVVTP
jgi:hypothetical protein